MKKILLSIGLLAIPAALFGQTLNGVRDATVLANGLTVPFRFEISARPGSAVGTFFNGTDKYRSSTGSFDGKLLKLEFDYYATNMTATCDGMALVGETGPGKGFTSFELCRM